MTSALALPSLFTLCANASNSGGCKWQDGSPSLPLSLCLSVRLLSLSQSALNAISGTLFARRERIVRRISARRKSDGRISAINVRRDKYGTEDVYVIVDSSCGARCMINCRRKRDLCRASARRREIASKIAGTWRGCHTRRRMTLKARWTSRV